MAGTGLSLHYVDEYRGKHGMKRSELLAAALEMQVALLQVDMLCSWNVKHMTRWEYQQELSPASCFFVVIVRVRIHFTKYVKYF